MAHKVCELYKEIYLLGLKLNKRDRFGIQAKLETVCLEIAMLVIAASLETKANKPPLLKAARVKIELLKRLARLMHELHIIAQQKYISIESRLQEISKMTNGWIKYLGG